MDGVTYRTEVDSDAVVPCRKCELPLDPGKVSIENHLELCIGKTDYVMHNQRAGMVIYLSAEEWEAILDSNQAVDRGEPETFPISMATAIAGRAVFGLQAV